MAHALLDTQTSLPHHLNGIEALRLCSRAQSPDASVSVRVRLALAAWLDPARPGFHIRHVSAEPPAVEAAFMDALRRAQAAQQRVALKSEALQTLLEDSIKATSKPQYKAAKKAKPEGREIVLPQHFDLQDFLRRVEHAMDAENAVSERSEGRIVTAECADGECGFSSRRTPSTLQRRQRMALSPKTCAQFSTSSQSTDWTRSLRQAYIGARHIALCPLLRSHSFVRCAQELKKHVQDIKLFQRVPRAKQLDFLRMLRYRTVNEVYANARRELRASIGAGNGWSSHANRLLERARQSLTWARRRPTCSWFSAAQ